MRKIIAKVYTDTPKTVYIEANGACEVKAENIVTDHEIDIINGDLHIATLSDKARLYMEIVFENGRGYVTSEKNKEKLQTVIGVIPVDSVYSPVDKVNYTVTNCRVGQITDYDKLTIEIFTDGTIAPEDALSLSSKIITEHMNLFTDLSDGPYLSYIDQAIGLRIVNGMSEDTFAPKADITRAQAAAILRRVYLKIFNANN